MNNLSIENTSSNETVYASVVIWLSIDKFQFLVITMPHNKRQKEIRLCVFPHVYEVMKGK